MSMSFVSLLAGYGALFALCGAAVRIQFSLFRGFDFVCAIAVLVAAEVFVWCSRIGNGLELVRFSGALGGALTAAIFIVAIWNVLLDRALRDRAELGGALLILSLGVSTASTGLVTLMRGPGLRQSAAWAPPFVGSPALYAVCAGGMVLTATLFWTKKRSGFSLDLWAQDPSFAKEIGIHRQQIAMSSGIMGGACLGLVGSYFALAGGSTPEIGLPAFLYGAASALLLPGNTVGRSVLGGLILGPVFVALQLVVAPTVSNSILFVLTLGLLLYRGTSRSAQQVR